MQAIVSTNWVLHYGEVQTTRGWASGFVGIAIRQAIAHEDRYRAFCSKGSGLTAYSVTRFNFIPGELIDSLLRSTYVPGRADG